MKIYLSIYISSLLSGKLDLYMDTQCVLRRSRRWALCGQLWKDVHGYQQKSAASRWRRLFSVMNGTYLDLFTLFSAHQVPNECCVQGCKPPQRDLMALMILNRVPKIFPFLQCRLSTTPSLLAAPQEFNPSNQLHMSWKAAGKLWNLLLPL